MAAPSSNGGVSSSAAQSSSGAEPGSSHASGQLGSSSAAAPACQGSLLAWWKLDETTGTAVVDSSNNHLDGTLNTPQGDDSRKIVGKVGGAHMFDGMGDLASIPSPAGGPLELGMQSFSYSMWVFPLAGGSHECAFWKGAESTSSGFNLCGVYGSGGDAAVARISDGTTTQTVSFGQKSLLNRWSFLAVVVDRSDNTIKTFVDGVYTGNSGDISNVGSVSNGVPVQLGMGSNWLPYNGAVDDVRIHGCVLPASEMEVLRQLGDGRRTLLVTKDPSSTGTGTVTGGTITCGTACSQNVDVGTVITLTAMPDGASMLDTWAHAGCAASGPCAVTVGEDVTLPVRFRDPTEEGKIINAASCAQADVQAALDGARNGNIVVVPPGACTWGAGGSSVVLDKAVTLQGAGRGMTVITRDATAGSYASGIVSLAGPATVRGFTMVPSAMGNNAAAFSASANGFRITDVEYLGSPATVEGYFLYAGSYGVVDHCDITGGGGSNELIFARGPLDSWQTANSMGGAANLFIEDCSFGGSGYLTDCNSNSRCVVRFNTVSGKMKVDGHGKASNSPPRGVRHMEVYGNTWTPMGSTNWAALEIRGGTGRFFSNTAADVSLFFLTEYSAGAPWPNFGGVIQTPADYPIDDQIGVGRDAKRAASEPAYVWSNRAGGAQWPISLSYTVPVETMRLIIAADRDYYNEVAGFDGTSGVGVGPMASRPATCTLGVGYWATDVGEWDAAHAGMDGQLFRCTAPDVWQLDYQPYPHPHPAVVAAP